MVQFYSFAPHQALKSLEKCLSPAAPQRVLENYRNTIQMVCQKIQEEFPGRRKDDQGRDLIKKAKALERQVEKRCSLSPGSPKMDA